ncbi:MAG: GGDEF domain-containing protein [Nitrospiria bacterium]
MNRYKNFFIISGFGMVVLIGLLDYLTGPRIYFLAFYIIPIFQIAWFVGKWAGFSIALFSIIMVGIIRYLLGVFPPDPLFVFRQALIVLNVFLVIGYVVSIQFFLRNALNREGELARTDSLTGTFNTRAFNGILEGEIRRASRYNYPLSIVYIDLDNFKEVNDRYGHSVGNSVLQTAARIIKDSVRKTDVIARLGGDEFAILFPETKSEQADQIVSKVHSRLNSEMTEQNWPVTSSIGLVSYAQVPGSPDHVLREVDQLMYKAKNEGKNRVKVIVIDQKTS